MNPFFIHHTQGGKKTRVLLQQSGLPAPVNREPDSGHRRFSVKGSFGEVVCDEYQCGLGTYRLIRLVLRAELLLSFPCAGGMLSFDFCISGSFRAANEKAESRILAGSFVRRHYSRIKNTYCYMTGSGNRQEHQLLQFFVPLPQWPEEDITGRMKAHFKKQLVSGNVDPFFPSNLDLLKWILAAQKELLKKYPDGRELNSFLPFLLLTATDSASGQFRENNAGKNWDKDAYSTSLLAENMILRMDEYWSIQKLAGSVKYSEARLKSAFKRNIGMSSTAFRISVRLEKARQLLLHTSLMIREIAADVGYSNPANFCRLFRSKLGCSPNTFRKRGFI